MAKQNGLECQFVTTRGADGLYYHRSACGLETRFSIGPNYTRMCDRSCEQVTRPGDRLKACLERLGIRGVVTVAAKFDKKTGKGCGGCKAIQNLMNLHGVSGCRENRARFLAHMRQRYDKIPLAKRVIMLAKAVLLSIPAGLAWKLSPTDPLGSLFDLAVDATELEILERNNSKKSCLFYDPYRLSPRPGK